MALINHTRLPSPGILARLRGSALSSVALLLITASPAQAADLPAGGQIAAGSGSIATSGSTMTVTQDTAHMVADWQSFSIGQGHSVNFVQPAPDAVALNRVLGSDVSVIQGALTANGRLFLVNPNGVLFTPDAQVNAGGIVASTLDLKTDDFLAGDYTFAGDSTASVTNRGHIDAPGGFVALIAATIVNEGSITSQGGAVLAGAGSRVTLDLGGPVKLEVEQGALDTLIEQGGAIRADGGRVFLTAKAAGTLATSVINHTGIAEAQTLVTGEKGEIILLGDMAQGTLNVGGTLNAVAPSAGHDGGFIETSAAHVHIADNTSITTGDGGTWLIDPYNYVIGVGEAAAISGALNAGGAVTIDTTNDVAAHGSSGNGAQGGDITINSAIEKTSASTSTLTLNAHRDIAVNANITSTDGILNLTFNADSDRDLDGAITVSANLATRGGNLNFGTDNTYKVGTSFSGAGTRTITALGNATVNFYGDVVLSTDLTIGGDGGTNGATVTFHNTVNSANIFTLRTDNTANWAAAKTLAESLGGYLATITSPLENSMVRTATGGASTWLGGHREGPHEWRWMTGPEGQENGGAGLLFYNQFTGITPAGAYSNWTGGEPNGSGPGMQMWYNGGQAKWDDIPDTNANYPFILETPGTPRNLTIDLGNSAGNVTFAGAVGKVNRLNTVDIDAGTGGQININGGYVRSELTQSYAQNIRLGAAATTLETVGASTDFTLVNNWNIANATGADAALTIKSARGVVMNAGSSITSATGKLDTTLWADSDDTNGGYIWTKASAGTGATISTNGGAITLSGGTNTASGYATGVNGVIGNGVTLDTATLQSGDGDIVLRGRSSTTTTSIASTDNANSSNTDGIRLHGGNTIDSGTGTIAVTGVARGTTGSSNGIETNQTGYSKITSASTSATAITLSGNATAGSSTNGWGTFLWGSDSSGIVMSATGAGGGISLNGLGRNVANGGGTHLEPGAFVLAASGPIAVTGTKGAASTYEDVVINSTIGYVASLPAGFGMASPVTSSTSNITLTADSFSANRVFGGGTFSGSAIQSSGILTIAPRTNGRAMTIQTANPGAGPLWINPTSMFGGSGLFKTGFSKFVFGDNMTGNVTLDNYNFNNDTEINSAAAVTLGAITIADNDLIVNVTGGGNITDTGNVAVNGLKLSASTSAVTLDNAGNAIGKLAANVASLTVTSSSALSIGNVEGMDGINATGLVDVATLAGDLTLAKNITTTSTADNAVTLNAGKSTAAGTSSGGNIVISGAPVITMGAGGRATLFTGSASGSTGLAAFAGTDNYRYNSDETDTRYTAPLGAGKYAIYREAPVITITAGSITKVFDNTPYSATPAHTVTGSFLNGETQSVLSGTLTHGGTAMGATKVGTYTFTVSGPTNDLGYTINYADGTLTITDSSKPPEQQAAQDAAQIVPVPPAVPPLAAPALPPATPQTGNNATGPLAVGTMEVVQVSSSEQQSPDDFSFARTEDNARIADFLKVFVVDGGINIPGGIHTAADDEE